MLVYVTLGALIALRRPGNTIGWLFCMMGLALLARGLFIQYMFYLASKNPAAVQIIMPFAWLPINLWVVTFGMLPLLVLMFPTRDVISPGWRSVIWFSVISISLGLISSVPEISLGAITLKVSDPIASIGIGSG